MAKGKGGKRVSAGPHKHHGPKKHLFREFKPMVHVLAQDGVINKYDNRTCFEMACTARGVKHIPDWLWTEMAYLKTKKEKDVWFKNLSSRNISKEIKDREDKKKQEMQQKQKLALN